MTREYSFSSATLDSTEEDSEPIRVEEFVPLFEGPQNPNHDIFIVPTQEGADKDDQWNGSIGDATMEHIYQQRHKMLELEHFISTPNGNIFRTEATVAPPDEDGQRGLKVQQITVMTAPGGRQAHDISTRKMRHVSVEDKERVVEFLKQEIDERRKQKEENQDVMDQVLVPFDDWEANPQMTSAIDIPSTPPVMYIYAGNSSQMFYDWVAEDHPDLRRINSFLSIANSIDWDRFDEHTVEFFRSWIFGSDDSSRRRRGGDWAVHFTAERLMQLCRDIAEADKASPAELTIEALKDIETNWFRQVCLEAQEKFSEDPIARELREFEKKLQVNISTGKLSWAELSKFGRTLYEKYSTKMTGAHWTVYHSLKKKYAPEVRVGKVDVNRANMNELRQVFRARFTAEFQKLLDSNLSEPTYERKVAALEAKIEKLARNIWLGAPYMTLEDLADKGLITVDDIGYTNKNVVAISLIKKAYHESINFKSLSPLGRVAQQIINLQRKNPNQCTEQEWFAIWQAYRLLKKQAADKLGIKDTSSKANV